MNKKFIPKQPKGTSNKNLCLIYIFIILNHVILYVWGPEASARSPGDGVDVGCEAMGVGANNETLISWKNNTCSQPPSHLFRPLLYTF